MSLDASTLMAAVVSDAAATGHLEDINRHEPKSAPQGLLTGAVWVQDIDPIPEASGLASTTALVTFTLRIFKNMLSEPQDAIDPEVLDAVDALCAAYSADFTLGGLVRNVDLLKEHSQGLRARAGYVPQDGRLYRVMDISLPLIVNDLWTQVA